MEQNLFNGIVELTEAQYGELKTNGSITVDGNTITFDENTLYVTTDSQLTLAELTDDSTHRLVTDAEKAAWNGKQNALPTTATAGKVLKSTSISGITEWGDAMDKANPTGTGSLSLNRASGSTVGTNSVAIGNNTTASGNYSFSCGESSTASGESSFATGRTSRASGDYSHAVGLSSTASGYASQVGGQNCVASGQYSNADGLATTAQRKSQHVFGEYNVLDTSGTSETSRGSYVEIVGNGTLSARSNARTLDWNGNEYLAGKITPAGGISDGNNVNYELQIPDTTNWTGDKTIATTDQIPTVPSNIESTDNKVTSISSSSTDTQYPSAKAVYDSCVQKQGGGVAHTYGAVYGYDTSGAETTYLVDISNSAQSLARRNASGKLFASDPDAGSGATVPTNACVTVNYANNNYAKTDLSNVTYPSLTSLTSNFTSSGNNDGFIQFVHNSNGTYGKTKGGLIIQFGTTVYNTNAKIITLPTAFVDNNYAVVITKANLSMSIGQYWGPAAGIFAITAKESTRFSVSSNADYGTGFACNWIAIGKG